MGSSYNVFIMLTCSSWQTDRKFVYSERNIDLFCLKLASACLECSGGNIEGSMKCKCFCGMFTLFVMLTNGETEKSAWKTGEKASLMLKGALSHSHNIMIHIIFSLHSLHVSGFHSMDVFFRHTQALRWGLVCDGPVSTPAFKSNISFHVWPCTTWLTTKQPPRNL